MTESATILAAIIEGARAEWELVPNRENIPADWWIPFLGYVPDDVDAIGTDAILALSVVTLTSELAQMVAPDNVDPNDLTSRWLLHE